MKFKENQRLLNKALVKRITALEIESRRLHVGNEASRGSFASLFPRVERLETKGSTPFCHTHNGLEDRINALEQWRNSLTQRLEDGARAFERVDALEDTLRQEIKNKGIARECSNAQAAAIMNLERRCRELETQIAALQTQKADEFKPSITEDNNIRECDNCKNQRTSYKDEPCHSCHHWEKWRPKG